MTPEKLSRRRFLEIGLAGLAGAASSCSPATESARQNLEQFSESPAPTYEPTPSSLIYNSEKISDPDTNQLYYAVSGSEVLGHPNPDCNELFLVAATVFCHFSEMNKHLVIPRDVPDHIIEYLSITGVTVPQLVKKLNDCFNNGPHNRKWNWPRELKREQAKKPSIDNHKYGDDYAKPSAKKEKSFWDDYWSRKHSIVIPSPRPAEQPQIYTSPSPGQNGPNVLEEYWNTQAVPALKENAAVFNFMVGTGTATGIAIAAAPEISVVMVPHFLQQNPSLLFSVSEGIKQGVSP